MLIFFSLSLRFFVINDKQEKKSNYQNLNLFIVSTLLSRIPTFKQLFKFIRWVKHSLLLAQP